MRLDKPYSFGIRILRIGFLLLLDILTGCSWFPAINQSPPYEPPPYVVPVSRHGASLLVEVQPVDDKFVDSCMTTSVDPVRRATNPDCRSAT